VGQWIRRYRLYVWDHYDPRDRFSHVQSRHRTVAKAIASAKPPVGCPPCGWSYRVEDGRSGRAVAEGCSGDLRKIDGEQPLRSASIAGRCSTSTLAARLV
jgi:hypothetical protein